MVRSLIPRFGRPLPVRFETEMENLMDRFFGDGGQWLATTSLFSPHINLAETDGEFVATVELPGMKSEDFHVEMEGSELRISGEKKEENEELGKTFHRVERTFGQFHRVIPLPTTVDAEHITAVYKDGVLTVKVPKTEAAKSRKIEVKT